MNYLADNLVNNIRSNSSLIFNRAFDLIQKNSNFASLLIGSELEFFLFGKDKKILDEEKIANFISQISEILLTKFSLIYEVEKEQGIAQIEIKFRHGDNLLLLCEQFVEAKKEVQKIAVEKGFIASFAPYPLAQDCTNACQLNLSLLDEAGNNIFCDDKELLQEFSAFLLEITNYILVLIFDEDDYKRCDFDNNINLFKQGKYIAPINLSHGFDNRTCLLRIADKSKRLEYRIAGANCDIYLLISIILIALSKFFSLDKEDRKLLLKKYNLLYGNSFDEQYSCPKLCQNYDEAWQYFNDERNLLRDIWNKIIS